MGETKKVGGDDGKESRKPYMGMVGVRHRSGSKYLHGSDVQHSQTIALFVSEGVEFRHLYETRYHDNGQIIEIEMTPLQWLELITNPNTGCGVPCTLRRVRGEAHIAPPEKPVAEIDKAHREFEAKLGKIPKKLNDLQKSIDDLKVPKKTINELTFKIGQIHMELKSNLPFAFEQFKEATECFLGEAKATAETYLANALFRLGLRAAKNLEIQYAEKKQIETARMRGGIGDGE